MKKSLAMVLSAAMAMTGAASTALASDGSERMTITVMGIDWGYGPSADSDMEKYWEDLFDVDLEIEWVNYSDYSQKLNTLIASGSQPDVVQIMSVNNSYYYPIFTQAIEAGQFVDMTSYIFDGDDALSKPMIATMTLFAFVSYWNCYFSSIMYMTSSAKSTLQVYVQKIVLSSNISELVDLQNELANTVPQEVMRMAAVVVVVLPVLIVYPFLQKYFASGMMVGAVKG